MHDSVRNWIRELVNNNPAWFEKRRVLEYGSMDVSATPLPQWNCRQFFTDCDYVGVDWRAGKCVDVACRMHEYEGDPFDTIISVSTAEHDAHVEKSVARCWELLKPGGVFVLTTVNSHCGPHCQEAGEEGHYRSIELPEAKGWVEGFMPQDHFIEEVGEDIRFWAVK